MVTEKERKEKKAGIKKEDWKKDSEREGKVKRSAWKRLKL